MSEGERRVELTPTAKRQLRRLPPGDAARLRGPILSLVTDPHPPGAVKLVGTDLWRLRVGDLRVVSVVSEDPTVFVVVKVARRSESTYRRIDK